MPSCAGSCFCIFISLLVAFNVSLAISALIISEDYGKDECIGNYKGISFGYPTWLIVYGWTQLGALFTYMLIGICFLFSLQLNLEPLKEWAIILFTIVFIINGLFQFAWYIVGAVLFFTEVSPNCQGLPLYDFGLLFKLCC